MNDSAERDVVVTDDELKELSEECCRLLIEAGTSFAVAESLTGGDLASIFVSVPGISEVFRGGVVAYATETKASVLGVSHERLSEFGPVDGVVAAEMAKGAADLFDAKVALSTTGVAGPGPADGHAAGTVWVGLWVAGEGESFTAKHRSETASDDDFLSVEGPRGTALAKKFRFAGDRAEVRRSTIGAALNILFREISTVT